MPRNLTPYGLGLVVAGVVISSFTRFEYGLVVLSAGTLLLGYALFFGRSGLPDD